MQGVWIEVPAVDLERAKRFYEHVFGHPRTEILEDAGRRLTVIEGTPTVSLNQVEGFTPSADGSIPYFHLDGRAADAVARVEATGGTVVEPPAARADRGTFTLVLDPEGNALYLHTST